MHIVLYKPDIPQNTAAIIRLGACLNLKIHLIEPCGFNLNDKRFERVVMDYLGLCDVIRHTDFKTFLKKYKKSRIVLMTTKAKKIYTNFEFKDDDTILFGRESLGVPEDVHNKVTERLKIPMGKGMRSLNLSTSVSITLAENLRQTNYLNG